MAVDSNAGAADFKRLRRFLFTAAALTYLLVTMGGIVCVTGSGNGCPDWPRCYGQLVPPIRTDSIIEFMHRILALLAAPAIVAAAILSCKKPRPARWITRPPLLAVALFIAVITFGAIAVLHGLSRWLAAVDIGSALMVLALVLAALVATASRPAMADRFLLRSHFARLSLGTLILDFAILVSGVLVAARGSVVRCLGWPLYSISRLEAGPYFPFQMARLLVTLLAAVLLVAVVLEAGRHSNRHRSIQPVTMSVALSFTIELSTGLLMLAFGQTVFLLIISVAAATFLWASLVALTMLAGMVGQEDESVAVPLRGAAAFLASERRPENSRGRA